MDARALQNRLVVATGVWRRLIAEPLPKLEPGDPFEQIQQFELLLIARAEAEATPDRAKEFADATWDIVHDRPDSDPVKQAVVALHEKLALLTHGG